MHQTLAFRFEFCLFPLSLHLLNVPSPQCEGMGGGSYHTDLDVEPCQGCSWANWPPLRAFIRKVMKWMQGLSWITPRPPPPKNLFKTILFLSLSPQIAPLLPNKMFFSRRLVNEFKALESSFLCYQPSVIKVETLLESAFCSFFEWSAYETSHYQICVTWTARG